MQSLLPRVNLFPMLGHLIRHLLMIQLQTRPAHSLHAPPRRTTHTRSRPPEGDASDERRAQSRMLSLAAEADLELHAVVMHFIGRRATWQLMTPPWKGYKKVTPFLSSRPPAIDCLKPSHPLTSHCMHPEGTL